MRVLNVYSGNLFGGVETMLVAVARCQDTGTGVESEFALCFPGRLSQMLRRAGATVHDLGSVRASRPWTILAARRRLKRLLHEREFDAVVCHCVWPLAVFGCVVRSIGLPLVIFLHGAVNAGHWVERWAKTVQPELALCNSNFTAGSLAKLYPTVPAKVLYPLVDLPKRHCDAAVSSSLRERLETPQDSVVVLNVSRLESGKGQRTLLRALSELRGLPQWVCWLAGGAQRPSEVHYLAELRQLAAESGIVDRVRFLGHRTDVPELMSAADIYCQPNETPEGFGITFVEALNAGLPVLTTAMGAAPEIIDDTCGRLAPPRDMASLTKVLSCWIENDDWRRRLGTAGPARVARICGPVQHFRELRRLLAPLKSRSLS